MRYENISRAFFVSRKNRFVAEVILEGETIRVHVKNTGRLRELLVPGADVILTRSRNENRKYPHDLVGVYHMGKLFNIDSQAPNAAVGEWLRTKDFDEVMPEYVFRDSRIDFFMRRGSEKYLLEVKGCTKEVNGIGLFPDAPTVRGVRHLKTLMEAAAEGYHAAVAFVIGMDGVSRVEPDDEAMPEFGKALEEAEKGGVRIACLQTRPQPDAFFITGETWK